MQKPKLYLDYDNCITDSIACIVGLYNKDFQTFPWFEYVNPENVHTWDFEECKYITKDIVNLYFCSPRFYENLTMMQNAETMIWLLDYDFDITIVSCGYKPNLTLKRLWIKKNIPCAKFIGIDFEEYPDKSHIDMSDGILVDDTLKYLCTSNAKHKIVYGKEYPWNEENEKDARYGYVRCKNWIELYQQLLEILKEYKQGV